MISILRCDALESVDVLTSSLFQRNSQHLIRQKLHTSCIVLKVRQVKEKNFRLSDGTSLQFDRARETLGLVCD